MTRTVGPAALEVAEPPVDTLTSAPVGSGLAIAVYSPGEKRGGMACCLLPCRSDVSVTPALGPAMFVDLGLPALIERLRRDGGEAMPLVAALAGAAEPLGGGQACGVGARNVAAAQSVLAACGVPVVLAETGGTRPRCLELDVREGRATVVRGPGQGARGERTR